MLGVVEDDEQAGAVEALAQDPERVAVADLVAGADAAHAERAADGGEHLAGGAQRAELDEPGAVGHAGEQRAGRLGGERRLADAGGADAA